LGQFLDHDERAAVHRVVVPTRVFAKGELDVAAELEANDCFAAIVLEGMISHRFLLADQTALRLLGPGDVVSNSGESRTMLFSDVAHRVLETARIALIGPEFLAAVQHWPQLLPGLHASVAAQTERLTAQLAVCQLPRVDQRLMAMMWLLAESWGTVTPAGTSLPLSLTHDVLGALVGARRSTVTLALGELSDQGALIRQAGGWLLVQAAPTSQGQLADFDEPKLVARSRSAWHRDEPETAEPSPMGLELLATVQRLRNEHLHNVDEVRRNLELVQRGRIQRLARLRSRQTPS
jgi:CRP-like cAMP-binding protein